MFACQLMIECSQMDRDQHKGFMGVRRWFVIKKASILFRRQRSCGMCVMTV